MHATITVVGIPGPQGSKVFKGYRGGKPIMLESSAKVKPWREAVKWAAVEHARGVFFKGPVKLTIIFVLPRPKKPKYKVPATKPDLSKLLRATEDALTDVGIWEDDSRVQTAEISKVYPFEGMRPGAVIRIESLD